jgi:hypothetical protein
MAALLGGAYIATITPFEGVNTLGDESRRARLAKDFFAPALLARSRSHDSSQVRSLARAAEDHQALRVVADELALRLEGPGAYLLAQARLEARRKSLRELRLRAKMQLLRNLLENEGFRPEAFSEFLDTSARLDELPDAQAALDGNLGPWIESRSYAGGDEGAQYEVEASLHFVEATLPPPVQDSRGQELELVGPPLATALDAQRARSRVILALAIAAWIASLLSFVSHRYLPAALLVAAVGGAAALSALAALHVEGIAVGAQLLPPLLLVMAVCQAETHTEVDRVARGLPHTPWSWAARIGPLLAVSLLAMTAGDPITHAWGLVVAVGATLGAFAAHVLSPSIAIALSPPAPSSPKKEAST